MTDAVTVAIVATVGVVVGQIPAIIIALRTSKKADEVVKKADKAVVRADQAMTTLDTVAAGVNGNLSEMKALHATAVAERDAALQQIRSMETARDLAKENTESAVQAALATPTPTHTE